MPRFHERERLLQEATGIAEGEFQPAYIETARIVNVNIDDWSVDAVSDIGNKRWFDLQVMNPYFHYVMGEGFYCMPEVGALVWLCKPSAGKFSAPFILGFQAPFDEPNVSYRANRQNLNPGDMMMQTRDGNFFILRRGGVVQLGATPACQTIYCPIQNVMEHFCENWRLNTFGGEMIWATERDDQATDGSALTTFSLRAKQKANDPAHIAELTIGSHGEGDPLTMGLVVWSDGTDKRETRVTLQITNEGDVIWDLKKDWIVNAVGKYTISSEDDMTFSTAKNFQASANENANLEAARNLVLAAGANGDFTAKAVATMDAPQVKLGDGAKEPVIKGTQLVTFLTTLIAQIATIAQTNPSAPTTAPSIAALSGQLPTLISQKVFVE